jgi:hypothetical protein
MFSVRVLLLNLHHVMMTQPTAVPLLCLAKGDMLHWCSLKSVHLGEVHRAKFAVLRYLWYTR